MKVLVTGGAGFIGSNVVDALIEKGHDVAVVDNLSTGKADNVNKKARLHRCDICDTAGLDKVFEKEKPEAVHHFAAQINVRSSLNDPIFDARTNVLGSINLFECCRKHGVRRVVYSSSGGAVYGEPKYNPVDENHPVAPLSPYGASKYSVEKYLDFYGAVHGLDSVILRYGNVYGPRQDPAGEAGVVAIFTDRMLAGNGITINDDGNQTRDFVYVGDVARANLLALESKSGERIFNIGVGKPISVNDIVHGLEAALSTKAKAAHGAAIKGEVRDIYLNIDRAKKHLGFEPKVQLNEGLKLTVEWAKKRKK